VLAFATPVDAFAQETPAEQADRLFKEGRDLMKRGEPANACPRFAESQRLDPAPGTLLNLSECEEAIGKLADAWRHIRETLKQLPEDDDRVPIARQRAEALERRVPRLTIDLESGAPEDTRILLDETEVLKPGHEQVINPGTHVVGAIAKGRTRRVVTFRVAEGERLGLRIGPEPLQVLPPKAQTTGGVSRTWAWVAGGVGVAGLGAAAITGSILVGKQKTLDERCDAAKVCDRIGYNASRDGQALEPWYWTSLVVGGVGVATSVVLFAITKPSSSRTQVGAAPLPGGGALSVTGAF